MNNISKLDTKIRSYLNKKLIFLTFSGIVNISILFIVIWLSTFIADHIFYFSVPARWFVLILNSSLSVYLVYRFLISGAFSVWKMKRTNNYTPVTNEIGKGISSIGDTLTNVYQLSRESDEKTQFLRQLAVDRFTQSTEKTEFNTILKFKGFVLPMFMVALILIGSIALFVSAHEAIAVSAKRIINPTGNYDILPEYSFSVTPGDTVIINGNSLQVKVGYHGPRSEDLFLEYRMSGSDYLKQIKLSDHSGWFKGEIQNIKSPLEYQFRVIPEGRPAWQDKILSDIYHVDVKTPPTIIEMQVRIEPPLYTGLQRQLSDKNNGNIIAYAGSKVKLTATASKSINMASISFSDGQKTKLQIRDQKLNGEFRLSKSGTYQLDIIDDENLANQNPIEYQITALDDRYPFIELIDPGADIEVPPDAAIELLMEATDDFGFSGLNIHYQIISSIQSLSDSTWLSNRIAIPGSNLKYFQQTYLWNFQAMNVGYGDVLNYYLSVNDNDRITGPKMSKTGIYQIKFPTLDQIFEQFDKSQEENLAKTDEMAKESEDLKQKLEQIRRELKREKTLDWERKKEIESAIDKQKQIEKKISEIEKALEEAIKKMENSRLMSPEVLQKYQQLQELFKDLMTPELTKALEDLQKSLENMNKKEVDNSLANFQINQEEFKENLERTLELFKKVKLEQELDRLAQLSKEMLKTQQEMTESLKDKNTKTQAEKNDLERQGNQQKSALEQIDNTLKSLETESLIKEYPETDKLLQKSAEDIQDKNLMSKLDKIQQQMMQNSQQKAGKKSQNLTQDLEQLSNDLSQAKKSFSTQAQDKITSKMRHATDNLLALSKAEENIIRETKTASGLSDRMRELAAEQKEISDNASRVFQEIVQLSHETFALPPELGRAMGKAQYNMNKSISELEQRNQRKADNAQVEAMAALNETVNGLQQAMNDMQNADSPFGMQNFMEQLKQLAQGQGQINEQSMNLMQGEGGKPRLSPDGQQRMRSLAAEQRAIQESLDQLREDQNGKNALGSLGKISEDMEEVIKELEALKIDRKTIDRQQQILTRMLDAQKSVREREYSKERKREIGKVYARKSPGENMDTEDERAKKLQADLMRALKEGYNPDYEKLIEEYFKKLNQEYLKD